MSLSSLLTHPPIRYTIRQYFTRHGQGNYLDELALDSAELWDALRESHPNFVVPKDRESWLRMVAEETNKDGLDGCLPERAAAIYPLLDQYQIAHARSLGVGSAGLEYQLKKTSLDRHLTVFEYAPENVELLKTLFHECKEIRRFDLFGDQWGEYANKPAQVVILNRLDPLFFNEQWTDAFDKMGKAGVVHILYIPAWILSAKFYLQAHKRHLRYRLSNTPTVFTGWARTRQVKHRFWAKHYKHTEHALAGLDGFFLTKRA